MFQEETLALRKEGIGVVLDSELPHLIGIDDDLLSTGIILYHLKVRPHARRVATATGNKQQTTNAELTVFCLRLRRAGRTWAERTRPWSRTSVSVHLSGTGGAVQEVLVLTGDLCVPSPPRSGPGQPTLHV